MRYSFYHMVLVKFYCDIITEIPQASIFRPVIRLHLTLKSSKQTPHFSENQSAAAVTAYQHFDQRLL